MAALCAGVAAVQTASVAAAVHGDRAWVYRAIELDAAVADKRAALAAIDELIRLHADVLPQFAPAG